MFQKKGDRLVCPRAVTASNQEVVLLARVDRLVCPPFSLRKQHQG
jgi:hypothetical protein